MARRDLQFPPPLRPETWPPKPFPSMRRTGTSLLALVAGGLLLTTSGCQDPPAHASPETRVVDVVDTLHRIEFPDPYRWLEDLGSPQNQAWIAAQNAHAEQIVPPSPLRHRIQERLRELTNLDEVSAPRRAGDYEYFTMRPRGQELPVIYRRPVAEADVEIDPRREYEAVLDPHGLTPENTTRFHIMDFSPERRYLVYSERDGGMDEVQIRIRDLEDGLDLPESLPLALYRGVAFVDDEGLYYSVICREEGPRVRYHEFRTPVSDDPVVFGEGYGPETRIELSTMADREFLLYTVNHGWASTEIHVHKPGEGFARAIVDRADARFYPRYIQGELYLRTNLGADRNRLVAVDLANPAPQHWREVIAEGEDVLEDFAVIDGRLYVTYLHHATNRIAVFEMDGSPIGEIPLPELHSASIRSHEEGEALLTLSSFIKPATIYRVDLETGERTLHEPPDVDWDGSGMVVQPIWRPGQEGERALMFMVHLEDVELDGNNPTLLTGYGGFYSPRRPSFSAFDALWLEMGGVYAVAILRGGSEYGESWHRDGWRENKQNVFDDFIQAAEWLIESGYTNPERLAIRGGSNGGLLVGAALTQRPELFRAVLCGFPDVDILRFPFYTENNSPPALLEYGDSRSPEHFEAIRQYSPYQNVRDGTAYPAIMFTGGDLDTRVPPQGVLKFTAALQAATTSDRPIILRYHEKAGHSAGRGLPFSRRLADTAMEMTFLAQELGVRWEAGTK